MVIEERPAPANWAGSLKATLKDTDMKKSEKIDLKNEASRWNVSAQEFHPSIFIFSELYMVLLVFDCSSQSAA